MAPIRKSKCPPPEDWEIIEEQIADFEDQMRNAEKDPHEGKRKVESLWPILKIHHKRSKYIFDLFYKKKSISKKLFDYCIENRIADKNLIAKWKKSGYENLCCLGCIQKSNTSMGTNCICRVPKMKLEEGKIVECQTCGCRGCSG